MIGAAHWSAHVLQCPNCRRTLFGVTELVLEGAIQTFGWPIYAFSYARSMMRRKKSITDQLKMTAIEIAVKPGESPEDFKKRVEDTILAHVRGGMKKAEDATGSKS